MAVLVSKKRGQSRYNNSCKHLPLIIEEDKMKTMYTSLASQPLTPAGKGLVHFA